MRKTLLATVAAAAVVGFTTLAAPQTPEGDKGDKGAAKPQGAQQQPKAAPGGAMMRQQGGAQPSEKALDQKGGQSAQGQSQGAKPVERLGQGREDKGQAMPQRDMQQKGAQEEPGKPGLNAAERNANQAPAASRGASVQLSEDQRGKIHAIIGHDNAARVGANVNFNISVGAAVPRSVHVEVLPDDIVEIVPQYEGFDYIVVGDEILIIDPRTLEIVAIIPA